MKQVLVLLAVLGLFFAGCAHSPQTGPAAGPSTTEAPTKAASKATTEAMTGSPVKEAIEPSVPSPADSETKTAQTKPGEFNFLDETEEEEARPTVADPIEPWNRAMYHFNDFFYLNILEPTAKGYRVVVPYDFRLIFKNFFDNLGMPVRFVSSVLQGNGSKAGNEMGAFLINSTVGVLGFATPAQDVWGLKTTDEDMGQAFGKWGIGHGFYIVWPVLGSSSARDTVGMAGDYFLSPLTYVDPSETAIGLKVFDVVNATSFRIGDYESLKGFSLDPYISLRDAYIQRRAKQVSE